MSTPSVSVVTITCSRCGRLLSASIPRVTDDDELEVVDEPVGFAFAQTHCRHHPADLPLWNVRHCALPDTPPPA